jgi:hypothetical protein
VILYLLLLNLLENIGDPRVLRVRVLVRVCICGTREFTRTLTEGMGVSVGTGTGVSMKQPVLTASTSYC